jgi:GNAT superfamily N-acetyltransferase
MVIRVHRVEYPDVAPLRELYRQEANCQIIHDAILPRGWADPYVIEVDGRLAGYGGVWNRIDAGRLMEFYTLPHARTVALSLFRELLGVSRATSIEAQSNMPLMMAMLYDCGKNVVAENILFHDAWTTGLTCPDGLFRRAQPEDTMPQQHDEPLGQWVIEAGGEVVATGGFLCHYNPPYADVYMEVTESARRKGYGSYLVQEVKRVCYESGKKPAARCSPSNVGSRRTLEKAGLLPCGRLLTGEVRQPGE